MNTLMRPTWMPSVRSLMEDFWNTENWFGRPSDGGNLPAVNIRETEKNYDVEVAAPGFEKKDFKVDTANGVLTISAERKKEKEEKEENYTRKEFAYSSFTRSFTLPETVKEENVKAKYENGVLHIILEKIAKPQEKKKLIAVE